MNLNKIIENFLKDTLEEQTKTGSYEAERKYLLWLFSERKKEDARYYAIDISKIAEDNSFVKEVFDLYTKKYRIYDFSEICVTKHTEICLHYDKHCKISDCTFVEYDDSIYALIEKPKQVTNDLYSAHAFKLSDDINMRRLVPMYNMAWEIDDEEDNPPYIIDDPIYVQDLQQEYDIWKGTY